jgi:2,4-dienoyl-CoA reductase-like NADH-dependent reductase (Old Yellow Enzyme family)
MVRLFEPLTLRGVEIPNRVFMSPMCLFLAQNGHPTDWHKVHYGARAVGGVGLVMVEATGISPEGRISPGCLGLWSDDHAASLRSIAEFIRAQGSIPALQLAHSGRRGSLQIPAQGGSPLTVDEGGWPVVGPSALPFTSGYPMPHALSEEELHWMADQYVAATRRALSAGFDIVEVHMAHGYLLHTFLSPISNQRTDGYGGSWDGRVRFPLEVTRRVRMALPDHLPLFVRVPATDWASEGGWDLLQTIRFCSALREIGVDFIDVSSGGILDNEVLPTTPGFQVPFAAAIKAQSNIATGAVGLITDAHQAEEVVASGQADAVLLGRELLRNPHWPLYAADELGASVPWPYAYRRGKFRPEGIQRHASRYVPDTRSDGAVVPHKADA